MRISHHGFRTYATSTPSAPIVRINGATFYRQYPSRTKDDSSTNPPLFPGLNFELPSNASTLQHWAVIGPSNVGKTTLFEILRGQHICLPPTARSFPYLASEEVEQKYRNPARAIQHVGFAGERGGVGNLGTRGAYLSARYESRREETDFSVLDYLKGNTELNPTEEQKARDGNGDSLRRVVHDLNLEVLLAMPMGNLSNGQTRRARIARALLGRPMLLLLDEPFLGLDPPTVTYLSKLLQGMAEASSPRLVLSLRPQDPLPDWITHIIELGPPLSVSLMGPRSLHEKFRPTLEGSLKNDHERALPEATMSREGLSLKPRRIEMPISPNKQEVVVSMKGVQVSYGKKTVLGGWQQLNLAQGGDTTQHRGLWWDVHRGERWSIFGPNGSGKTTLIALICSDHPQAYAQPVEIFGRHRLPKPGALGISVFDLQAKIGQSSPEIHAFFPKQLTIRQTLENAWADTFLGTPTISTVEREMVQACLRLFRKELDPTCSSPTVPGNGDLQAERQPSEVAWANKITFGQLPFSAQRVALFLRAIIKKPDLVVLDEAFSGMDDYIRDKCLLFLTWGEFRTFSSSGTSSSPRVVQAAPEYHGKHPPIAGLSEKQALICVSHVKEEVPGLVNQWMRLPESSSGKPPRFGQLSRPLEADEGLWKSIWGS